MTSSDLVSPRLQARLASHVDLVHLVPPLKGGRGRGDGWPGLGRARARPNTLDEVKQKNLEKFGNLLAAL